VTILEMNAFVHELINLQLEAKGGFPVLIAVEPKNRLSLLVINLLFLLQC
jgi:hypothetical protein